MFLILITREACISYCHPPLPTKMLNLDLLANGDSRRVNQEAINRAMQGLDPARKEFISSCLEEDPTKRLTASALIKSKVFQEVRSVSNICLFVCLSICLLAHMNEDYWSCCIISPLLKL